MWIQWVIDNYVITPEQSQEKSTIFTCTWSFRIFAMNILLDWKNIKDVDWEISEKVKTLKNEVNLHIDEILAMLNEEQLRKLEDYLSKIQNKTLYDIFLVFVKWTTSLKEFRKQLVESWEEDTDDNLIKFLEKLVKETEEESERWEEYKLIAHLYAKKKMYWEAIDYLNKTILTIPEDELWRIITLIWIYFEKMWYQEYARDFLMTAKNMGKSNIKLLNRLLKIWLNRIQSWKSLENLQKAA